MKILRIMSICIVCIVSYTMTTDTIKVQPPSTLEWLLGYRSYTPEEQQIVDFFAQLEERPIYTESWFKQYGLGERIKMANNFIKFIEIKSLQSTFPRIYEVAQDEKKHAEKVIGEEYKPMKPLVLKPVSRENIKKGLAPGISIKE